MQLHDKSQSFKESAVVPNTTWSTGMYRIIECKMIEVAIATRSQRFERGPITSIEAFFTQSVQSIEHFNYDENSESQCSGLGFCEGEVSAWVCPQVRSGQSYLLENLSSLDSGTRMQVLKKTLVCGRRHSSCIRCTNRQIFQL